jgi:uncharacterized protein (TIGR02246 family)
MKASLYALTTALVLAAVAPVALSAASEDEAAIRQACANFAASWNKHDAKAMAATWAEEGDLINPFGAGAKGRAGIEKFFVEEHATVMRGTTYTAVEIKVRMLSPTIATTDWTSEITGMKDPSGAAQPAFKHHVFVIHEKKNGQWSVVSARAFSFLPAPPAGPARL